jgi:pantetheine-phosphate adenylyltransferase
MKKLGIYAGSFDPVTNGHMWVIEQGLKLFDYLYVVVAVNPSKKTMFTGEERAEMILDAADERGWLNRISVNGIESEFLIHHAMFMEATHIIRGIRSSKDFEDELLLRNVNDEIARVYDPSQVIGSEPHNPIIPDTVFVIPPPSLVNISSSMVKGLIGFDKWELIVDNYVPYNVLLNLKKKNEN